MFFLFFDILYETIFRFSWIFQWIFSGIKVNLIISTWIKYKAYENLRRISWKVKSFSETSLLYVTSNKFAKMGHFCCALHEEHFISKVNTIYSHFWCAFDTCSSKLFTSVWSYEFSFNNPFVVVESGPTEKQNRNRNWNTK